jgi:hypothetical protein
VNGWVEEVDEMGEEVGGVKKKEVEADGGGEEDE